MPNRRKTASNKPEAVSLLHEPIRTLISAAVVLPRSASEGDVDDPMATIASLNCSIRSRHLRQRGQALIYGLFVLSSGLVALFFLFNTGQLSSEKTKLVNTADAVAYSAGVLHARALNFDAYTNRAMIANEVLIAQMVSVSSWIQYAQGHVAQVPPLNCYEVAYSVPFWLGLVDYLPLCVALSWPTGAAIVDASGSAFEPLAEIMVRASETAKANLQLAQSTMFVALLPARAKLMQEVADANYINDGEVRVDLIPLTDDFSNFDGSPFIKRYADGERKRFKDLETLAAYQDQFVYSRSWSSRSPWPCILAPRGDAERDGRTELNGFDDWKASDRASLSVESWHIHLFSFGCETDAVYALGNGGRSATDWGYSGVPKSFDLSETARAYSPNDADAAKRDPRLRFSIRLTRSNTEARTSMGRAAVKPTGRMDIYKGAEAANVMAAVATSEVYFERSAARADGKIELASLFNPYWQVHLISNSPADVAAAIALQSGGTP